MQLAQMDQKIPANAQLIKVKTLLLKISKFYDLPVDSIADKFAMAHRFSDNKPLVKLPGKKYVEKKLLNVNNLKLMQMIDSLDNRKVPGAGSSLLSSRIEFSVFVIGLKKHYHETARSM